MSSEDIIIDPTGILRYLTDLQKSLILKFGSERLKMYVHGSLVNNDGRGFKLLFSDIDLVVATNITGIHERIDFLVKLKDSMQSAEEDLKSRIPKRRFFPIISVCVVTQFELNEGIHKNRNSPTAFFNYAFRSLDFSEISSVQIGERLRDDLVGIQFPAWAILSEVQEIRSNFVTPKASPKELEREEKGFNHRFLPLPKEMLRNAYILDHYRKNVDEMMIVEDDIAEGFDILKSMLKRASDTDVFAQELLKLVITNSPWGQNPGKSITSQQLIYLWELLFIETEIALGERRRGLDTQTLTLAAPPVIVELSRLRKTSLEAIDMAIELYESEDLVHEGMLNFQAKPHQPIGQYEFSKFDKVKLIPLINEWPDDIRDYLLEQLDVEATATNDCECKIGFSGVFFSHLGMAARRDVPSLVYMHIRPLNFWILSQFNLAMAADPGNPQLRRFREKYGRELFQTILDYQCSCPSGLYIEAAVVTGDGEVTVVPKSPKLSYQAQGRGGSSILTCGFEHGLSWNAHVLESEAGLSINVKKAMMEGLKKEFLIEPYEVESWKVSVLAVHHVHLNAALLGVVYLNISSGQLSHRLKSSSNNHFKTKKLSFLSRDAAKEAIIKYKGKGEWHQTALMRLNLIK